MVTEGKGEELNKVEGRGRPRNVPTSGLLELQKRKSNTQRHLKRFPIFPFRALLKAARAIKVDRARFQSQISQSSSPNILGIISLYSE